MRSLPANLPDIGSADLPATYEDAKNALARCESLDECKDWSDKAQALASYAAQAKDDTLERMAQRIRARAIRRSGELLSQIDGQGARTDQLSVGTDTKLTQRHVAEQAGLSERQQVTAVRVANVSAEDFDAMVEGESVATITALAERGKRSLVDLKGVDPKVYANCTQFVGLLRQYAKKIEAFDLDNTLPGLRDEQIAEIRHCIGLIDGMHDKIITRI